MGAFSNNGPSSCPPLPDSANVTGVPITGSLTFQHLIQYIGWGCFGLTMLVCIALCIPHFRRYHAPQEQRQIFRILILPVVYSITSVVSIHLYHAAGYIEPIAGLYEAIALASLFLLYVHYVAPEVHSRDEFFHKLEQRTKNGAIIAGGSLQWFRRAWKTIFYYLVIYILLIIIQEITLATNVYCTTSNKPRYAHVWLQTLQLIATVVAVLTVIRFQRRLKDYMIGRNALPKLVTFKLFVVITTFQHFVFSIVGSHIKGSSKVTYLDITIGLQALLVCVEALLCELSFLFFFRSKEYHGEKRAAHSPFMAFLHALSPVDLLRAIRLAFGGFGPARVGADRLESA